MISPIQRGLQVLQKGVNLLSSDFLKWLNFLRTQVNTNTENISTNATNISINKDSIDSINDSVYSGTYTPTATNEINASSFVEGTCVYSVVKDAVTVAGKIQYNPISAGFTVFNINIPVSSNMIATTPCSGAGSSTEINYSVSEVVGGGLRFTGVTTSIATEFVDFTATYLIV